MKHESRVLKQLLRKFAETLVIVALCLLFLYPLVFLLANSLRFHLSNIPILAPTEFHFENYKMAVEMIPFFLYLKNSFVLVGIVVSLSLVFNFVFGYAFARLKAPGKGFWFSLVLLQLMLPGIAVQIPQFVFFSQIGLKGTYWIWILGGIGGNAFIIFLLRQFLSTFPKELEEAAKIDGCNPVSIMTRIFLPLSVPALAVVFFFEFNAAWGDYMGPYMYLDAKLYPLAIALFGISYFVPSRPDIVLQPVTFAAALLMSLPVFILFFFCQKYLVQGIVTTGIKG